MKGIEDKTFNLNIIRNRPSLLVAPNGFGKSSFTCAFARMNNARIDLHDNERCQGDKGKNPRIELTINKPDGTTQRLFANHESNTIKTQLDCFVIKSPLVAKGKGSQFGRATGSMEIEDVVLVKGIPPSLGFGYDLKDFKNRFGKCGRVLSKLSLSEVLDNKVMVQKLSQDYSLINRINGVKATNAINEFIGRVNQQTGTIENLLDWIKVNELDTLKGIKPLMNLTKTMIDMKVSNENVVNFLLYSIQIHWLYQNDPNRFKAACKYSNYRLHKEMFDDLLNDFNTTWKNIRTSQTGGSLVVKFPKAHEISNGQRDILNFISMLFKAQFKLNKGNCILIIDEVFDYLDDANLITAQYYITKFIRDFKKQGRNIYPLILTHLNPLYFKNFAFSKQKVYYLCKSQIKISNEMTKLLLARENKDLDEGLRDDISGKLFHYHTMKINQSDEFKRLHIPEIWGREEHFKKFTLKEKDKYLLNDVDYDPFAVCCAVRVQIEELVYQLIGEDTQRTEFISINGTRKKLEYLQSVGYEVPEIYFLLGIVYNDGMHWVNGQDNISPIASKLENLTIKKLIREVFE
ncbi:hypothetical protein [Ichthyobacterium seriolicida]|uniref:hypothetical protein n=1 Tax=Ichthyobacterium seriolicida TaxID=242600 RepID=UPI001560BFC3|nr:hypothetical protein [Ichthyobacterium seriolicida]